MSKASGIMKIMEDVSSEARDKVGDGQTPRKENLMKTAQDVAKALLYDIEHNKKPVLVIAVTTEGNPKDNSVYCYSSTPIAETLANMRVIATRMCLEAAETDLIAATSNPVITTKRRGRRPMYLECVNTGDGKNHGKVHAKGMCGRCYDQYRRENY